MYAARAVNAARVTQAAPGFGATSESVQRRFAEDPELAQARLGLTEAGIDAAGPHPAFTAAATERYTS
eukprot:4395534-Lingulodinium_polyedra.AAC.1